MRTVFVNHPAGFEADIKHDANNGQSDQPIDSAQKYLHRAGSGAFYSNFFGDAWISVLGWSWFLRGHSHNILIWISHTSGDAAGMMEA